MRWSRSHRTFLESWLALVMAGPGLWGASLSDPEVDRYPLRVGSQTFGPQYRFTSETKLLETARAIRHMGSDVIKFYLGRDLPHQYGIRLSGDVTNLASLAANEPSCRQLLDMPFRHYVIWVYAFGVPGDVYWKDGLTPEERRRERDEIRDLTRYLLTRYQGTGKRFYLGHWEGDWHLLPNYNARTNPPPAAIQGMIDWLNIRQQAVDEAKSQTPHEDVDVFVYAEVNRVRDAMVNGPGSNQRVINKVIPFVPQLDYVSWSSYDGQNLSQTDLFKTLDYIQSNLATNKAALIPGKRVWVGEYGWGGSLSSADQEPRTRHYIRDLLLWGCPFILFWQMYDNENKAYWLIDNTGVPTPSYHLHHRFYNLARLRLARFRQDQGRLPEETEFAALVTSALGEPLAEPISLRVANGPATSLSAASARVSGTIEQGVYGQDQASVSVFYGEEDGGSDPNHWSHRRDAGLNTRFGPAQFDLLLTDLKPGASYFYRYYATNSSGSVWAPSSASFDHRPPASGR